MGGRKRFVNSSLKQNTKIMAPVFNRFCLSASKTLKLGGLAYHYKFELSVHLRNVMRKINHHKYDSLFHHFSILDASKFFLFLLGTVRFRASLFKCSLFSVKQTLPKTNLHIHKHMSSTHLHLFIRFYQRFCQRRKKKHLNLLFTSSCFNILE